MASKDDGRIEVPPATYRGKRPVFAAKIGTHPGTLIVIRRHRQRRFKIGDYIRFFELSSTVGMRKRATPEYHGGFIL